jgi:hypothetical protein
VPACLCVWPLQETERKLAELRVRRKDHVRAVLMQQNFLLGEAAGSSRQAAWLVRSSYS